VREPSTWWASLKHGGLLIAPSKLLSHFPDEPPPLPWHLEERLRREVVRLAADRDGTPRMLDTVLEQVVGLGRRGEPASGSWIAGSNLGREWTRQAVTGEALRPRRVWRGDHGSDLPVFVDDAARIGVGRGRRAHARTVEWLRKTDRRIALLTNARQWRIVHAGADHDAFAEADVELWFEEGRPGPQVTALRALLAPAALTPPRVGEPARLLAAIEATRRGQAELSADLGERVRRAVERLIQAHGPALAALDPPVDPRHIYLAATRVVMRLVVVLFAEARDLLPRDHPAYHDSYGLGGLRESLEASSGAGAERLRHRHGAWPRALALFRLIHDGSAHEALPVPRYGGGLFEPGSGGSDDPTRRALAVFESACFDPASPAMPDSEVHDVLGLLTRGRVRVRQGRASTWVEAPVDFSDLSSEYIGILYEGLLDYELHRAEGDDPVVFLELGDRPALPLSRLEVMEDRALAALVEKLKQKGKSAIAEGEGEGHDAGDDEDGSSEDEEGDAEDDEPADDDAMDSAPAVPDAGDDDLRRAALARAHAWGRRAAAAGKLVPKPRARSAEARRTHEAALDAAAKRLVGRVVLPAEWFLVRFGGTRKGSGTFYTKPALAVPTTRRTLLPLAYDPPQDAEGRPDEKAPPSTWTPKRPEEVLALKVCDPACGSGSFLVAALRFLTEALAASLHHHGRIAANGSKTLITLAEGRPDDGRLAVVLLPRRPDAEDFESRLAAVLMRHVVERSIYGVDLDPLAVELCRLALWVETMDRELPFTFLDHKIKVGNSLVGCWFDRFRDYPALAFEREGGDKAHGQGVHHAQGAWTKAIKEFRNRHVKPALRAAILGVSAEDIDRRLASIVGAQPETVHDDALAAHERLHSMAPQEVEERSRYYREHVQDNPALARLRQAFDTWCALWFWPADQLDTAPLPTNLLEPTDAARAIVDRLTREHRFFHWEIEFPDVFREAQSGFDAVVGNPPWEIQKPNSKEFFSNLDPLYRSYGKQEALARQKEIFERSAEDERAWLDYAARFKALSSFTKHAASPFGDGEADGEPFHLGAGSDGLHGRWREIRASRAGYADRAHPFRHQGSADVNTYKLFLEAAWAVLHRGGRLGLIVPSGLYTDKGSTELRKLFLGGSRWRWLFGFENRDKIFDIDSRFKFCPVIVEKGGRTEAIDTAFMRRDLADWEVAEPKSVPYAAEQVTRFSPRTFAILEIREKRDLEVLEKIYANSVLLGDDSEGGWGIRYATEFHMTNDSKLFPPRPWWEERGYRGDEYGRWLKGRWRPRERDPRCPASPDLGRWELAPGVILSQDGTQWIHEDEIEDVALPLYEGRMIGQFDFSQKGWVRGKGRSAEWTEVGWDRKCVEPQYLMGLGTCAENDVLGAKVPVMNITSATNSRTVVAAFVRDAPCNHSLNPLRTASDAWQLLMTAALNSLVLDFAVRCRLGGLNLSFFVLDEAPAPRPAQRHARVMLPSVLALTAPHSTFASEWRKYAAAMGTPWKLGWARTLMERQRLRCVLDAVLAEQYGVDCDDVAWLLRDCDYPTELLRDASFARTLDPKGFWRVDKDKDPELRHTVLTLAAFRDLDDKITTHGGDRDAGIKAFYQQNEGQGWMVPETLRLSDLGLGHDDRARRPQPVRERLGDRFYAFQLEQSTEDSWKECELHARNLLGDAGFRQFSSGLGSQAIRAVAAEPEEPCETEGQRRLFPGEHTLFGDRTNDPGRAQHRRPRRGGAGT